MVKLDPQENSKCEAIADDLTDSMHTVSLLDLQMGEEGIVKKISGGYGACKRLNELGLVPNVRVEMVNKINSGPVMIRVKGSKLALGRGLAMKVLVLVD
jgi:ferrous iron transport protein A